MAVTRDSPEAAAKWRCDCRGKLHYPCIMLLRNFVFRCWLLLMIEKVKFSVLPPEVAAKCWCDCQGKLHCLHILERLWWKFRWMCYWFLTLCMKRLVSCFINSENWRFHFWKNNVVEKLRFCQGPCLVQILRLPLDFWGLWKFSVKAIVLIW